MLLAATIIVLSKNRLTPQRASTKAVLIFECSLCVFPLTKTDRKALDTRVSTQALRSLFVVMKGAFYFRKSVASLSQLVS